MARKPILLLATLLASISACGSQTGLPGPIAAKIYVVVSANKAASFTKELANLVKRHGFTPNLGGATDGKGHALYVLDATSPSTRLRSENVLLDGIEDPAVCGVYDEPHRDPGQYFISVSPSTSKSSAAEPRRLLVAIADELKADGHDVRQQPVTCSELSKLESEQRAPTL